MEVFDNPAFDPEDVVEVEGGEVDDDTIIVDDGTRHLDDLGPSAGRTATDPSGTSAHIPLQRELLMSAADDYYNTLAKWGETPSIG